MTPANVLECSLGAPLARTLRYVWTSFPDSEHTLETTLKGFPLLETLNLHNSALDLQRNYYCKNVVRFEANSILLLPEYLESSEWQF